MSYSVPVLLITFNRPEHTRRVLDALRLLQPQTLYVAADGPRHGNREDGIRCAAVRGVVSEQIDWPCQIRTLFSPVNLGCRKGVEQAMDWFFSEVEEGVILEDDVLPTQDFFWYCEELLARYRFDQRVGSISGNSFLPDAANPPDSYYFSDYTHSWGWATWRRAWSCYDKDMVDWVRLRDQGWLELIVGKQAAAYWIPLIDQVFQGVVDTWDLIWLYSCWKSGFLTCVCSVELVENIGFGIEATHTIDEATPLRPAEALIRPLSHPMVMQPRRDFDVYLMNTYNRRSLIEKLTLKLKKVRRRTKHWLGLP
jgi:hypothetical protein